LIFGALRPQEVETPPRTATVERGDVVATVTASGSVQVAQTVEISFTAPGTVTRVAVETGDTVSKGQLLARIDATAARQQVAAAKATLEQAKAQSAQGSAATAEANAEAALAAARKSQKVGNERLDQAVVQARANLTTARSLWSDACLTPDAGGCPNPSAAAAIRSAENAVSSAELAYETAVSQAASGATSYEVAVNQAGARLTQAQQQETATCSAIPYIDSACVSAKGATLSAQQAYENAIATQNSSLQRDSQNVQAAALSLSAAQVGLQRTQADLSKAGADAVRAATQALSTAESARRTGRAQNAQAVQNAEAALASARTASDIESSGRAANQAAIDSAEAAVELAEKGLAETRLRAPIPGTIGALNLVAGQNSAASSPAANVTILPAGALEVVAAFAESDAADIVVGDRASVTFEALPGVEVPAAVLAVAPLAATSTTGLVTYDVRVGLDEVPDGVREGMTASVSVVVDEAFDVLRAPQGAITTEGDRSTVELLAGDGTRSTAPVTLGIQGDVDTEITSGVSEGDVLVIPSAENGVGLTFPQGGVPGGNGPPRGGGGG
jgi:HlyD family secretion protein